MLNYGQADLYEKILYCQKTICSNFRVSFVLCKLCFAYQNIKSWILDLLQWTDKISRDISRDIWKFLLYFELVCIFHYISKFLSIYTRISHGTPINVVRNPCCDPGLLYDVNTFSVSERSHVSRWSDNAYEYCDEGHSSLLTTGWRRIG